MPSDADHRREKLRQTFETVPALYDRVRPTYPDELLDCCPQSTLETWDDPSLSNGQSARD